ncbi:Sulfur carrier protein ThiS adenylyltransferase [Pseudovibrio sp. Ad46]|uniref:ThiF family adenylyltransferase n=1 Tax=unclassified Pseudovibrio TaxID=2627060 RepID=UPI0007AEAD3E|nr:MULTISPECIES: ThiF family adenylyltransferase [unclassified Pseudovibrio]KZK90344.1 Sulfur carrier protein ThiS adenylyltransferase [Pseudovibrio sp. Ad46]KZK92934.1 Sulfur carrier protein ThiS adenylyltransferase [Pseudovibrio sp. Ad5]
MLTVLAASQAQGSKSGTCAGFSYDAAFSRNIGWVTPEEQQTLRGKRVAIAGMGGVGGIHAVTLARLGIGAFSVADFDHFDIVNFNRQIGATVSTLQEPKVSVMAEQVRNINPEVDLRAFPDGVTDENIDAFLEGVDMFVDGFDFFVLGMRRKVFAKCRELGIPAVTAAPLGMGTAYLCFTPDGMSFEDYFQFEGEDELHQYFKFLLGLAPSALHRHSLVDTSQLNLKEERGPSTAAGCQLAAGVVGAQAIKLLLGRGPLKPAPWYHHFDAYEGKFVTKRLPSGNGNFFQKLRLKKTMQQFT